MIPILFPKDETVFTGKVGLGALVDCISCTVTEIRDTWEFECEFQYPINGRLYNKIKPGCIVFVDHDATKTPQPFDIYAYETSIEGITTFHAHHVSYRLSKYVCIPRKTRSSGAWWIDYIVSDAGWIDNGVFKITNTHFNRVPYTYHTLNYSQPVGAQQCPGFQYRGPNLAEYWDYSIDRPKSAREVLAGTEGSIFDLFHCEYKWDKFNVWCYTNGYFRGTDRPVTIRYDYNLTGLQYEYDTSNTAPAIIPYWIDPETNAPFYLSGDEDFIPDGGGVSEYDRATVAANGGGDEGTVPGDVTNFCLMGGTYDAIPVDLSDEFDEQPTPYQLLKAAEEYAETHFVNKPHESLSVDFQWLQDFHEYENYIDAQQLLLCDTCTVVFPELNLYKRMKVVKTVYDPLAEGNTGRYTKLELGSSTRGIFTVDSVSNTPQIDPDITVIEDPDLDIEVEEVDIGDGTTYKIVEVDPPEINDPDEPAIIEEDP